MNVLKTLNRWQNKKIYYFFVLDRLIQEITLKFEQIMISLRNTYEFYTSLHLLNEKYEGQQNDNCDSNEEQSLVERKRLKNFISLPTTMTKQKLKQKEGEYHIL